VAAVIDKDLASAVLAEAISADLLVISTAVEKVCLNYGKPNEQALDCMTAAEARRCVAEGHFQAGSMLPKVQACLQFLEAGGREALITCPEALSTALAGKTGTRIVP
jgi:carbamate kinase